MNDGNSNFQGQANQGQPAVFLDRRRLCLESGALFRCSIVSGRLSIFPVGSRVEVNKVSQGPNLKMKRPETSQRPIKTGHSFSTAARQQTRRRTRRLDSTRLDSTLASLDESAVLHPGRHSYMYLRRHDSDRKEKEPRQYNK